MKIDIHIDLKPEETAELNRIAKLLRSIYTNIDILEEELENYRQRLEKVEEMTTRFEPES
jgi:predicted DNA-binding protein YlxM (UPF0122 family)